MTISLSFITIALVFMLIGALVAYFIGVVRRVLAEKNLENSKMMAKQILEDANKKVEAMRKDAQLEAKDSLFKMRQEFERDTRGRKEELNVIEKRMVQKEENLERRVGLLEKKEREMEDRNKALFQREESMRNKEKYLEKLVLEEKERLQKISSMTPEEAKILLLSRLEQELNQEKAVLIRRMEDEVKDNADKKAREIVTTAIQRCAVEQTVETTVSVVNLPNEEMKGRIIGREGRNIRALEMATGVDVIIDDTPEAVTLSGFDTVRREIARIALERLISDGRIHPGRIEEVIEKTKRDMEVKIKEEGEKALFDVGMHNMHPELVRLIGRLKYRTSYGQNVLQHSKEVSLLMGELAIQLGLDSKIGRRIGILHDIGKAIDQQTEGTHASLGADLAKKYGESEIVVKAIGAHHEETESSSLYGVLAIAADAISASRPGARRETLETYIKRLEKLESIATLFKGVDKAFAIQAGREIRVIVLPDKISDADSIVLAREIKKKIEEGMEYPGQVKVTVIRETRAIEYAK
ncbi:MAG: ribonuclease Y [Candidatus Omnitrophica bacterium]|nr:ribonuclease Y [Candidatus Omnitrophota bacterium]MDD5351584.1 ribonuclease Y [Candidatus Omnitrophota bacterium]MDD5551019.1 ribonuclease Y [Candidatus Omnitrophota bacterium]